MATFTTTFLTLALLVAVGNAAPNREIKLKLPEECKGKGFCTIKPEGYEEMLNLIDSILTPEFVEAIQKNLQDRDGGPTKAYSLKHDWHNCPYINETTHPVLHSDDKDSDFDLIIQNSKVLQPIQSITCSLENVIPVNTDEQCFGEIGLKGLGLASRCRTLQAERYFTVFDTKKKEVVTKPFSVNSCCSCDIYKPDQQN